MASKPPVEPYPPDADPDAAPTAPPDDVVDAVVSGADWANARAIRTTFLRVELREVRLTGAEAAEARLRDVVFDGCRLDLAGLRNAQLERVVFRDCRMEEADLYGARLEDVLFERCVLREATLSAATVERVEVRGCDLAGLRGAEALRGVRMPWHDAIQNGPLFAAALGLELIDDLEA